MNAYPKSQFLPQIEFGNIVILSGKKVKKTFAEEIAYYKKCNLSKNILKSFRGMTCHTNVSIYCHPGN